MEGEERMTMQPLGCPTCWVMPMLESEQRFPWLRATDIWERINEITALSTNTMIADFGNSQGVAKVCDGRRIPFAILSVDTTGHSAR